MNKLILITLISVSTLAHASREERIIENYEKIKARQEVKLLSSNISIQSNIQYDAPSANKDNKLDIYYQKNNGTNKPVIVMIHGGAWLVGDKATSSVVKNKAEFFVNKEDYIFVSINYRMEKNNIHPQEVSDVSYAIKWVYENINKYGGDKNNLIVMGHSAGAHLATLVTTNHKYLNNVNVPVKSIKGVVSLDTGGFDLPYLLRSETIKNDIGRGVKNKLILDRIQNTYEMAWKNYSINDLNDASPINFVNRNVPATLLIESSKDKAHQLAADRFQKVLLNNGVSVDRKEYHYSHEEINDNLGLTEDPITKDVDDFIKKVVK